MTPNQNKVLPVLFCTLLLDTIGFGMVFPIIPIIFTDPGSSHFLLTGSTQSTQFLIAGAITAIFGLMQFIASPILGELSDIYGRKRILTFGVGVLAFSQLLFGMGINIAFVPLLFAARAIAGLAAGNISVAQAAIADITEPAHRAKNFGIIGAAFGMGFIIGPLLGGWITALFGNPAIPFWVASALGLINVVFISLMLPETHHVRSRERNFSIFKGVHNIRAAIEDVEARPVYLANFFYMCGFTFFTTFIGILLVSFRFSEAAIGTFFGAVGVCIVITQLLILRILANKYSERAILRYTMICVAICMAIYPFVGSGGLVFLLIPFLAVPQGLSMANLPALVSKSVSPLKQGAALGINTSLIALSSGIVPLVAGLGSSVIGIKLPFIAGSLLVLLAWSTLFVFGKKR